MYGNSFFNPNMYQPYYQASNLARGLGGMNGISNFGRATASLGSNGTGLTGLKGLLGKFSFSGFLNGASKTLNVVNQAIPIFYQVKPIINNAKTMFRIMGAVKNDGTSTSKNNNETNKQKLSNTNIDTNNNSNINDTSITSQSVYYEAFNEENPTFFI